MAAVNADDITAAPGAETPAPAPAEEKDTDTAGGELPDALLKDVPALGLLLQGAPPATYAPSEAQYPELKAIEKYAPQLGKAGFGIYQTKDKANVVLFNGLYITPEEVKQADEAGQLDQVAAPYDQLRAEFGGAAGEAGGAAPASGANSGVSTPPAASGASGGPPASVENKLTTARVSNLDVGAPTSGPVPGQGRIINNILKPVV